MKNKYTFKNMTTKQSKMILLVAGVLFALFIYLALTDSVLAHDKHHNHDHNTTINNYYNETNEACSLCINSGISESDMNEIVASALAGGSHQFDFSTTHWQLSVTGATSTSDWDEDSEFSFGAGKRFGKDHWMPNALYHIEYTPDIGDTDYISFGATFVLE